MYILPEMIIFLPLDDDTIHAIMRLLMFTLQGHESKYFQLQAFSFFIKACAESDENELTMSQPYQTSVIYSINKYCYQIKSYQSCESW